MTLELFFHPLSSYCMKALIALYENGTPFQPRLVDLGDAASRAAFLKLSPIGKMPVLKDSQAPRPIPESSIVIEYLDAHHPGKSKLVPSDPDLAREVRAWDRFFDRYVMDPMAKIVTNRLRPSGKGDELGVAEARATLATAYAMIESGMADKTWAVAGAFSMAECAAAPALFYANKVVPLGSHRTVVSYLERLMARPSFARVLKEAEPYLSLVPKGD